MSTITVSQSGTQTGHQNRALIVRCLEDAPEEQDDTSVDVVVLDGLPSCTC